MNIYIYIHIIHIYIYIIIVNRKQYYKGQPRFVAHQLPTSRKGLPVNIRSAGVARAPTSTSSTSSVHGQTGLCDSSWHPDIMGMSGHRTSACWLSHQLKKYCQRLFSTTILLLNIRVSIDHCFHLHQTLWKDSFAFILLSSSN